MTLTPDQLRGRARVLINGEEKFLRFDQGALSSLTNELGIQGLADIPSAIASLDADVLSVLVWSGRLWEEPDLTIEQTRSMFFPLIPTYEKAIEAINLALWGDPSPGGSEDDADPTKSQEREVSGTS